MKLDDFDPPVLAEKSSAQYKREIFGDNWERMTPQKLKWLIALSGPANDQYYGKGETRRGPGPGIKDEKFPKKAERKKTSRARTGKNSMVVGPGDEPSKPFDKECNGNNACIAKKAKELVDQYFAEKPPGQPLSRPLHPKDTQRKRAKMPRLTVGPDGEPKYKAPRPTGTYAQTGKKRFWGGVRLSTDRGSSPAVQRKEVDKLEKLGSELEVEPRRQRRQRKKPPRKKKSPGTPDPGSVSPEDRARAEQARLKAAKASVQGGGARSGPRRGSGIGRDKPVDESRNYISDDQVDEKIIQALYG